MSQSLRQVKNRIKSIENITKITQAMDMVSVSRLRSLQKQMRLSSGYFLHLEELTKDFLASFPGLVHPLCAKRTAPKKLLLYIVGSDTGLCGSYNSLLLRQAEEFIRQRRQSAVNLICVGKKTVSHFKKKGFSILDSHAELYGHYSRSLSDRIAQQAINSFLSQETDEVYFCYSHFESAIRISQVTEKILELDLQGGLKIQYLTEPGAAVVSEKLIPLYLSAKVSYILLRAFAAEQASRARAMSEATDNAKELLKELVLQNNKMRQASITRDLIEVISAADALKGQSL